MEVVGGSGVVVVVDDGGEEEGEDLEVGHPVLEPGLGDAAVSGLKHVRGVEVVVVGRPVTEIVMLRSGTLEVDLTRRIQPRGDPAKSRGWREQSSAC